MITQEQRDASITGLKVTSAWAGVAITSWSDLAAFLAALYSFLLICDWLWKKMGRPYAEEHGWIARKHMRATDVEQDE